MGTLFDNDDWEAGYGEDDDQEGLKKAGASGHGLASSPL
jgi:hypothetical protein